MSERGLSVSLEFPPEFVEAVAQRPAEILAEQRRSDGFLDAAGAAEFLACPTSRIYQLSSLGRLPVRRDGSRLLFDRDDLRDYVRNGGAKRP